MPVSMWCLGILAGFVIVLLVLVVFGQVQVDASGHAQGRAEESGGDGLVEEHQREAGANEGGE